MSNNALRVAIYIRVSTVHQVDKDSLRMQQEDLENYCKYILNTSDYEIFKDAGYSGKNTDRPQFRDMMAKVRNHQFTHILVWKIDRISRNLLDFASMYEELKRLGVVFVSKNEQFDTSSAMGEAMLKIILVFAELERNMTAERVTATMISRASNGLWNGGRVPYGYIYDKKSKTFLINEEEAEVVLLIYRKYEELRSLIGLAKYLSEHGYKSKSGSDWDPVVLHKILTSVFYVGDYRYNVFKEGNRGKPKDSSEWITVKNHHAPIVSRETSNKISQILKDNQRSLRSQGTYSSSSNVHIFAGLIFCAHCDRSFRSVTFTQKRSMMKLTRYMCGNRRKSNICKNPSVSDLYVGEFIFNLLLNIINLHNDIQSGAILTSSEISSRVINGDAFNYISGIYQEDLELLSSELSLPLKDKSYSGMGFYVSPATKRRERSRQLRQRRTKYERASDRLQNLYLYDDLPKNEYLQKRAALDAKINDIDDELSSLSVIDFTNRPEDDDLVKAASQMILSESFKGRNYISFFRVLQTVDDAAIKKLVTRVIDRIYIADGRISEVSFKSGIRLRFTMK